MALTLLSGAHKE